MSKHKTYLGDAVYADFDGFYITLTTENGICATNTIHLEPSVYGALAEWVLITKSQSDDASIDAEGEPGKETP